MANHAAGGLIGRAEYTMVLLIVTLGLGLLMVSNVRFRSFKELRVNPATVLFVLFVIASSAFVWQRFRPEFVMVWLLGVYVAIGILDTTRALVSRLLGRERESLPPG
jgi:CDP-diacylglycerol--serine O-phosphatidyltransferase